MGMGWYGEDLGERSALSVQQDGSPMVSAAFSGQKESSAASIMALSNKRNQDVQYQYLTGYVAFLNVFTGPWNMGQRVTPVQ